MHFFIMHQSTITATNDLKRFNASFTKLSLILFLLEFIPFQTSIPMLSYFYLHHNF